MTLIWYRPPAGGPTRICEDRPSMVLSSDGIRLELIGRNGTWVIELTSTDCERIAEEIGFRRPGYFRPEADSDS